MVRTLMLFLALAVLCPLAVLASPTDTDMRSASSMRALKQVVLPLVNSTSAAGNLLSTNISELAGVSAANGTLLQLGLNGTVVEGPGDSNDESADDSSSSVTSAAGSTDSASQRYIGPIRSSCVCAFDFDLTLRIPRKDKSGKVYDWDAPGYESQEVLQACQSIPCYLAIASANDNRAKIQRVLLRNYDSIFDPGFFSSQAVQTGIHNKSVELLAMQAYYGVNLQCIVLFDDAWFNRKYAERIGAHFEQVSNSTGVARWNFDRAMQYSLPSSCFPNGQRPPKLDNKSKGSSSNGSSSGGSSQSRSGKVQATQGPGR